MKTTKEEADNEIHNNIVNNLQAAQRSRFATELTNELRNMNAEPKESGSFTGDLHRAWIDIKTAVSGNEDEAVLEECIRGEKASADEYKDRLQKENFPPHISSLLQKQAGEINQTLNKVKRLEDLADMK